MNIFHHNFLPLEHHLFNDISKIQLDNCYLALLKRISFYKMGDQNLIKIDGSFLEGGGQILRIALSLSSLLKIPVRISKIRANRPNPGLSHQHLYGLNLLADITDADVKGNVLKSTEVEFSPKTIKSGDYYVNTQTAASVSLIIQAALPVLLFAPKESRLLLKGGTNVGMAPQVEYLSEIFRPHLEQFGATFEFEVVKRGYYPRGGGEVIATIEHPIKEFQAINICEFGEVDEIIGWCFVAGRFPLHLAANMKTAAIEVLHKLSKSNMNIEDYKESIECASDNGAGVILLATTTTGCIIGASSLGEKRVDGIEMGSRSAKALSSLINEKVCVDKYVQDQLILYMALASGKSSFLTTELTNHTKTAIHVTELMTGVKFNVEQVNPKHFIISCDGIGFKIS